MTRNHARYHHKHAFTLIEFLVVIGLITILIALLLPAVSAARETARSTHCRSQLRQIGLAVSNYESTHGCLPIGYAFSIHGRLLPYLEQTPLWSSINFDSKMRDDANSTSRMTVVEGFLCPSRTMKYAGLSYPANRGFSKRDGMDNGPFRSAASATVRYSDIRDGTHSTVGFSEWVKGPCESGPSPEMLTSRSRLGTVYLTEPALTTKEKLNEFLIACRKIDYRTAEISVNDKGVEWLRPGLASSLYNHNLSIDHSSCVSSGAVQSGSYSAGSEHGSGAHTLFLDGHVRWMKSSTDIEVWRALGTINHGEVVSPD